MLGFDGKAVAGLRGLYGWLALKSLKARPWLIKNDSLTVALYSDIRPMELGAKKLLLREIGCEAYANPWALGALGAAENLSQLFQIELLDEYLAILQDTRRDDPTQTYVAFILKILKHSAAQRQLTDTLKGIAADSTRWERVRRHLLRRGLRLTRANAKQSIF
jgi:hypothetical protein